MTDSTILGPNPSGLCMCGCGGAAPIAHGSDPRYGIVRGLPQRYIQGHHCRKSPVPYIIDANGCWVWQRAVNSSGYGHLYAAGIHHYAHVYYYEQAHGAVGDNGRGRTARQVHHKCGNRLCVNPEHLEVVSVDAHRRGHGIYKIDRAVADAMRDDFKNGVSQTDLQRKYGLSQSHTSGILNRRYWSD